MGGGEFVWVKSLHLKFRGPHQTHAVTHLTSTPKLQSFFSRTEETHEHH